MFLRQSSCLQLVIFLVTGHLLCFNRMVFHVTQKEIPYLIQTKHGDTVGMPRKEPWSQPHREFLGQTQKSSGGKVCPSNKRSETGVRPLSTRDSTSYHQLTCSNWLTTCQEDTKQLKVSNTLLLPETPRQTCLPKPEWKSVILALVSC